MLDERRQIGHVLVDVTLSERPLALAVSAAIVRQYPEGTFERWDDGIPVVMVTPRAVDEDEEIP
jgi:hypothetical protein